MADEPSKEELTREALQKTLEWAETAEGFVSEQAPAVAREMVTWGYASHAIEAGLGVSGFVLFGLLSWWLGVQMLRSVRACPVDMGNPVWFISLCASGIAIVFSGVSAISGAVGLVYIYTAPRLYVLEQTTRMLGM